MDPREHRLAENETLFRAVNEQVEAIAAGQGSDGHVYEFLCECSNRDCLLRIPLTIEAYEAVRSRPTWFVVAPGHDLPELELVIERGDGFVVVAKEDEAAEIAARADPRQV